MKTINEVKEFWEKNPLFSCESEYAAGTKEFFLEHRETYINDVFTGKFPKKLFVPRSDKKIKVLDLGCGIGFWTVELLLMNNLIDMNACDLTQNAVDLTGKRLKLYNSNADLSVQNAEELKYPDGIFDHINCQGVIHHTPDIVKAVKEIARVLKKDGTAYISVYYKNIFLKNWKSISWIGKMLYKIGAKLKGRGRENIFLVDDTDEITRLYDGKENPIGKSYSKKEIIELIEPYFKIDNVFLFFPKRALPIYIPKLIHRLLAKYFGFMIHLNLKKK